MPRWAKTVVAILLVPLSLGLSTALFRLLRAAGPADTVWVPLVAGAACWWAIYLLLPKPMWVYVFGHELTHALWTWLFEGRVQRFHVSARGGHVVITRNNFLITLAPYFFPLYAVLVFGLFGALSWWWSWKEGRVWFLLLLGAAYAFHLTLTWHALQKEQSDITSQGYVFSAVIIWLGNVIVLLLGIPLLVGVPYGQVLDWCVQGTMDVLVAVANGFTRRGS